MTAKTQAVERDDLDTLRRYAVKCRLALHGDTGCGGTFSELLCHDLHTKDGETYGGFDFIRVAERMGLVPSQLGLLLLDHCCGLEENDERVETIIVRTVACEEGK